MRIERIELPDAGAGLEPSQIIDPSTEHNWILISMVFGTLTCSAVAGTRRPQVKFSQTGRASYGFGHQATSGSSTAVQYSWLRNASTFGTTATGFKACNPLPKPLLFHAQLRFEILTLGFDAGDTWTEVAIEIIRLTEKDLPVAALQ